MTKLEKEQADYIRRLEKAIQNTHELETDNGSGDTIGYYCQYCGAGDNMDYNFGDFEHNPGCIWKELQDKESHEAPDDPNP